MKRERLAPSVIVKQPEKKTIKISSCKAKARRLQKDVAERVSRLTGLACGKDCPIESREMGQTGCDVKLDTLARRLFPYSCECKATEKFALQDAIKQAKSNCYPNTQWLVIHSRNREKATVTLDIDVFFDLLNQIERK
jgi:hypothetical protein